MAQLILTAQAYAHCGRPLGQFGYAVDNIATLSKGGIHAPSNLTVTCKPCNRAKGKLNPSEFRDWLSQLRHALV